MNKCLNCKVSEVKRKDKLFCSKSCASSYGFHNNLTYQQKMLENLLIGGKVAQFKNGNKMRVGKFHTPETKDRISLTKIRQMTRKSGHFSKGSFRKDLGRYFRSKWEANFARILTYHGINFEYESNNCIFNTPYGRLLLNFYLPDFDLYIEPKGYLWSDARIKLKYLTTSLRMNNIKIIDFQTYRVLQKMYDGVLSIWE